MVFLLTVSDLTARPLPDALTLPAIASVAAFGPGRLLVISTALSAAGALAALLTARSLRYAGSAVRGPQIRLVLSTGLLAAALIPWALGGHTTQSGADIAASSLIVHVLAAGAWIGGLAIMVLHVRSELLVTVLPRFSTLALWCWISIGVSGVITGWLRVGQVSDLWTTGYGRLLLVKLVALGVLGTFGYWHRRRLAAGLRARSIGNFGALLRLAAVEVLVMGATMGVATALSATAPPVGHAVGHEAAHGVPRIEAMAGHPVPVISLENLAVLWRPDVIVLLLVALSLSGYLIGVRRFRAAGGSWPAGRVCWAVAAAAAAVVALNSGIATYDGVVWSVTVTQQAITSMFVPLAVVLARPWELVRRTGTVGRLLGAVRAHPWLVLGSYAGWTVLCLVDPARPVVGVRTWAADGHPHRRHRHRRSTFRALATGAAQPRAQVGAVRDDAADGLVRSAGRADRHIAGRRRVCRPTMVHRIEHRLDHRRPGRTNGSTDPPRNCHRCASAGFRTAWAKVHRNPDIEYHSTQHSSGSNRFGPRVRIAAV